MLDYPKLKAWQSPPVRHAYTAKDTILYALGVGVGQDPLDAGQLRLTYETDLAALPTMTAVLATPGPWLRERTELGVDFLKLVHGEQAITLFEPLPVAGTLVGTTRVTRVVDKGEGKGAVLHVEKDLVDEASGRRVALVEAVYFLRGNGGFSKNGGGDEAAPAAPATPESAPDLVLDLATRPETALLYRLSGDYNPLHADPAVAAKAGFARPILHGLASLGVACHGIVKSFCDYDPTRLKSIRTRLSSPVYPGETIRLECWRVGPGEVAFRGRVVERDVVVLTNGRATL
ncbi:MAG: MaoC/PaaZ C-terminal domain-containing protein [Burkholderiales bacterium]